MTGEAQDGESGLAAAGALRPAVVLLDAATADGRQWSAAVPHWRRSSTMPRWPKNAACSTTAGAAARLALENERLHAELRARVEELERPRERIIEDGLAERRKLERNLHDGAQQRLVALALTSASRAIEWGVIPRMHANCSRKRCPSCSLRHRSCELARGIHPNVLSDWGLSAALKPLGGRVSVPVEIVVTPTERMPPLIEIASYYVIAEALTKITNTPKPTRPK